MAGVRVVPRREREPESGQLEVALSDGGTASLPADAMQAITAALMPALAEHGTVSLTFGTPRSPGSTPRPTGLIPGSARLGARRRLDRVVSVRLTTPLLERVRQRAAVYGEAVSDWIRDAAASELARQEAPAEAARLRTIGWQCAHVSMTAGGAVTLVPAASCGCEMRPIYAAA
jgi:hypothetical protein